jgi:hypothetical protein
MCFKSISNQVIGVLKVNWSLRQRQRLPLRNSFFANHSKQLSIFGGESMSTKQKDSIFGIIFTHSFLTKAGKVFQRALMIPFLAIHAKGGESKSPKQKDCTTTNFKNFMFPRILSIGILLCSKGGESSISKMIYQNPLEL